MSAKDTLILTVPVDTLILTIPPDTQEGIVTLSMLKLKGHLAYHECALPDTREDGQPRSINKVLYDMLGYQGCENRYLGREEPHRRT